MKKMIALLLALSTAAGAVQKGDIVMKHDYEGAEPLKAWNAAPGPALQLVTGQNGQALQLARTDDKAPSQMVQISLPAEQLRGCKIRIQAVVKAEGVSAPPNPWNGIKVMLHTKGPNGDTWPQQNLPQGTFDWRKVDYIARMPDDTQQAWLALGLELVTGKVWFDDVQISVAVLPRSRPATPPGGPKFTGHNLPRLRGAMIGINLKEQDFRDLVAMGANHVRWQLLWNGFPHSPADNGDLKAYDEWLESALKHLDSMLPLCRELGITICLDLHTPPGGRNPEKECNLFKEKRFQDAFIASWEKMARRYKGEKAIWGYDLVNEPVEGTIGENCRDWRDLALETTRRIRAIDSQSVMIIEAAPWGGPQALADFEPLPFERIVYSFHMYEPGEYTHQGVNSPSEPKSYPGQFRGMHWDKTQLRRTMQPVVDWARDYNVHVYVGEFSAIRWAPGAADYLRDVIELFEENNWDWAYHAYREWPGWSVEHIGDKEHTQKATAPTDRQKVLTGWFLKNQRAK